MSEVFYRKWRPRRLDQVVGQEAVVQTLRNAVAQGRVAHAYLFCGPRGTGKTSTARILAKAATCLSPQDGEPDNECQICMSINEARALDLIEIDAASNRGIDDIRDLREKVHFSPSEARYKVYIVDEVHMLTEPAFNALLKTLEEPPEHVIFVLCTTEVHKVPLTIISRCQRFDFRRIPPEAIVDRLAQLCVDEGAEAATDALGLIARAAAGSLRDAENLLEQALVSYESPLNEEHVRDLVGLGSDERALELVGHMLSESVGEGLTVINEVAAEGSDVRQFHRGAMEYLRSLLLIKSGAEASLGYQEDTSEQLKSMAEQTSLEHLVGALKAFAKVDLRRDSTSTLPLEIALVESSLDADVPVRPASSSPPDNRDAAQKANRVRSAIAESSVAAPAEPRPEEPRPSAAAGETTAGAPAPGARPADRPTPATVQSASSEQRDQWSEVVKSLSRHKGKRFNLGALLRASRPPELVDGRVRLRFPHKSHMERLEEELEDPQSGRVLRETFQKMFGGTYEIEVSLLDGDGDGRKQGASQRSHLVRAAQAMGAHVVSEKGDDSEQEDAKAGAAASEEHAEDAGGT